MRRSPISNAVAEEEDINLTPMLDVVFILLIFFIVTANFIKEPGLDGEIVVKSDTPVSFLKYWENDASTKEKIKNGWLHTGDFAYKDEEGNFYFKGREDDIAVGLDVDSNEPFEIQSTEQQVITDGDGNNFEDASASESNIVDDDNNTDLTQKNYDGKLLNFLPHTDPRISSQLRQIMENVAR